MHKTQHMTSGNMANGMDNLQHHDRITRVSGQSNHRYHLDHWGIALHLDQKIGIPGRISAGLLSEKDRDRSSGRPRAGGRVDFDAFPVAVRPGANPARNDDLRPGSAM